MAIVTINCSPVILAPANIVRTKDTFGVGEQVVLSVNIMPPGAAVPPLNFIVESGGGTIRNAVPANSFARFTAGAIKSTVKLIAVDAQMKGYATKTISVLAPNVIKMVTVTANPPPSGTVGAGFIATRIRLEPKNVCFEAIMVREGACRAKASGYYLPFNNMQHDPGPWVTVQAFNKVTATDDINSGDPGGSPASGIFEWPIPWEYRLGAVSNPHRICEVLHKQEINMLGHVTIYKGGQKAERNVNS